MSTMDKMSGVTTMTFLKSLSLFTNIHSDISLISFVDKSQELKHVQKYLIFNFVVKELSAEYRNIKFLVLPKCNKSYQKFI